MKHCSPFPLISSLAPAQIEKLKDRTVYQKAPNLLFGLLRRTLPDLPLHASTQMSLFTSGGAREIAADGCERVVIARANVRQEESQE